MIVRLFLHSRLCNVDLILPSHKGIINLYDGRSFKRHHHDVICMMIEKDCSRSSAIANLTMICRDQRRCTHMNIEGGPACLSAGTEYLELRSCPAVEFLQQRCSCIQWAISRSALSTSRRGFVPLFVRVV